MRYLIYIFVLLIVPTSCTQLIKIDPPVDQLTEKEVFSDSVSATAALFNIYTEFNTAIYPAYNKYLGMYSDELIFSKPSQTDNEEFAESRLNPTNSSNLRIWQDFYFTIYQSNELIENLSGSQRPNDYIRQYIAEAKFLRAFSYFYLTNIYGYIPLILTPNAEGNRMSSQVDSSVVYKQIIKDLKDAADNLQDTFPNGKKTRVCKWSAIAMLARVYLYQKEWAKAETCADKVISSGLFTPLITPDKVFLANSKGAILQFWTEYGYISDAILSIPVGGETPLNPLSDNFLNSFENGDVRDSAWIKRTTVKVGDTSLDFAYSFKYRNRSDNTTSPEYLMALRIAEQYLIRAEARAKLGNLSGAEADINVIRARAGLKNIKANSTSELMAAIQHENRVELFCEWGHRFLDLKRNGRLNEVIGSLKSTWRKDTAIQFPIPQSEIIKDVNLKQNTGY